MQSEAAKEREKDICPLLCWSEIDYCLYMHMYSFLYLTSILLTQMPYVTRFKLSSLTISGGQPLTLTDIIGIMHVKLCHDTFPP